MRELKAILLAGLVCGLCGCTQLFFQPSRQFIDSPARWGVAYQSEDIRASDGTMLNAWFMPAQGKAKGTVLFLHGNAENISTHFRSVVWLPAQGYNVLALDYRGYGASDGVPTLEGVQLDIDAAMRHLLTHKDVDPQRIVILGQSLSGALAIHYCAHSAYRANIRALVSDSAFSDYRRVARDALSNFMLTWPFQWLPWLLIDNDYTPLDSAALISPIPLLIIHGDKDMTVSVRHARLIFEQAQQPKELLIVPNAGHIQSLESPQVREHLLAFLAASIRAPNSGAAN